MTTELKEPPKFPILIAHRYGLDVESVDTLPGNDGFEMRLRLPIWRSRLAIDTLQIGMVNQGELLDFVQRRIQEVQRTLFAQVVRHIAERDKSPVGRLDDIERTAKELLEAIGEHAVPLGGKVGEAYWKLRTLLAHTPGAVSWTKEGW